jgi:hypothetical protein
MNSISSQTIFVTTLLAMTAALPAAIRSAGAVDRAALDLSAGIHEQSFAADAIPLRVSPSIDARRGGARFEIQGSAAWLDNGPEIHAGRTRLSLMPRAPRSIAPELSLSGVFVDPSDGPARNGLRADARLMMRRRNASAWLETGTEFSSRSSGAPQRALLGFGGSGRVGRFDLTGAIDQSEIIRVEAIPGAWIAQPDTLTPRVQLPGTTETASREGTHAHARIGWASGPLAIETIAGVTLGRHHEPRRWMQAGMTVAITTRVAFVTTAGTSAPQWFALEPSGERHATLGLRLTQSPIAEPDIGRITSQPDRESRVTWRIERARPGRYEFNVRAPRARTVELMGDITGWEPVALRRFMGGRFMVAVDMTPGVHRVNLRVDGGPWIAPPGAATSPDEFAGEVGVIVIE